MLVIYFHKWAISAYKSKKCPNIKKSEHLCPDYMENNGESPKTKGESLEISAHPITFP